MEISVGMLVGQKERQIRYKKMIEQILWKDLHQAKFLIFSTTKELYEQMVGNKRYTDILLLQASPANYKLAEKVRESDRNCLILYMAQNMDYVLNAFYSMPIAFIPSAGSPSCSLAHELRKAAQYLQKMKEELTFETKSKVLHYMLTEIDYFESQYRIVHIVKSNRDEETIPSKLSEIEKKGLFHFARCHQSYLVNMENIQSIDKTLRMVNFYSGHSVPSSKALFTDFLDEYREFQEEKAR